MSLVTTGQTFPKSIERMKRVLSETKLDGVQTVSVNLKLELILVENKITKFSIYVNF